MRYDTNDEEAVKKAEEEHKDMLNWFAKYVSELSQSPFFFIKKKKVTFR